MNRILCVLWKKEKDGREYYSGVLRDFRGDINIAIFPNSFKQTDNQPDMNIVISWGNNSDKADDEQVEETKGKKKSNKKKDIPKDDEVPF